jgi:hypothetical protein
VNKPSRKRRGRKSEQSKPRNNPAERVLSETLSAAESLNIEVENGDNRNLDGENVLKETKTIPRPILQLAEFEVYVDLYKFFLKMCLSVNAFFFAVLGGLLTFLFRPAESVAGDPLTVLLRSAENVPRTRLIDTLIPPIKLIFLITPFIISGVLMLSFAIGAWYWWVSTLAINKKIKKKHVEVELITRPFFHLLTFLLVIVAIIFMFVTYLLGRIMAHYGILFCDVCFLQRSRLPEITLVALITSRIVNSSLLLIKSMKPKVNEVTDHSTADSKGSDSPLNKRNEAVPED